MTPGKRAVPREPAPESQAASAVAELKEVSGQLAATGDLRERVTVLETDSKHYATKADLTKLESKSEQYATKTNLANMKVWALAGIASALLSVVIGLVIVVVRLAVRN